MNIAVIPARGGSRRIPRKNIRLFHGKPIIAYSIETAKASGLFDMVVVSTDSEEIAEVACSYGALYMMRPPELAHDEVGTWEVVRRAAIARGDVDYLCCIYATAPMMHAQDIASGYARFSTGAVDHAISVSYPPLQDAAQFYWSSRFAVEQDIDYFDHRTALVKIPAERVCDINTPEDWDRAEQMYTTLVVNEALLKIGSKK